MTTRIEKLLSLRKRGQILPPQKLLEQAFTSGIPLPSEQELVGLRIRRLAGKKPLPTEKDLKQVFNVG
jgi:hypothetical protein